MPYQTNKLSLGVGLYNPQSPLDFFIICGYLRNLWFFSCPLVNLVHLCGQLSGICSFFLRLFLGVLLGGSILSVSIRVNPWFIPFFCLFY